MFKFKSNKSVGLDISDRSIEMVELIRDGEKTRISSSRRVMLEKGVVENGRILDKRALKEKIDEIFKPNGTEEIRRENVIFAIPDSKVIFRIFDIENSKDIKEEVIKEIDEIFGEKASDESYIYETLQPSSSENTSKRVLVAVTSRALLEEWISFFKASGIHIEKLDLESQAVSSVLAGAGHENFCIIDMGLVRTTIAFFYNRKLFFSYTLELGMETAEIEEGKTCTKNELIKEVILNVKKIDAYLTSKRGIKADAFYLTGDVLNDTSIYDMAVKEMGSDKKIERINSLVLEGLDAAFLDAFSLALKGAFPEKFENDLLFKGRANNGIITAKESFKGRLKNLGGAIRRRHKILAKTAIISLITFLILYFAWPMMQNYKKVVFGGNNGMIQPFKMENKIIYRLDVATDQALYDKNRIRGKIFLKKFSNPELLNKMLEETKNEAIRTLGKNEKILERPLNDFSSQDLIFPFEVKLLSYNERDVRPLLLYTIRADFKDKKFYLKKYEVIKAEAGASKSLYALYVEAEIFTEEKIGISGVVNKGDSAKATSTSIKISAKDKGTTFRKAIINLPKNQTVNIRKSPDKNAKVVGKASGGAQYGILDKKANWIKILYNKNEGWVMSQYVQIK